MELWLGRGVYVCVVRITSCDDDIRFIPFMRPFANRTKGRYANHLALLLYCTANIFLEAVANPPIIVDGTIHTAHIVPLIRKKMMYLASYQAIIGNPLKF